MVRAKFKVEEVSYAEQTATVSMTPVYGGSKENEEFYRWTPGGSVALNGIKHETAAKFIPGKEYYVDFTLAE